MCGLLAQIIMKDYRVKYVIIIFLIIVSGYTAIHVNKVGKKKIDIVQVPNQIKKNKSESTAPNVTSVKKATTHVKRLKVSLLWNFSTIEPVSDIDIGNDIVALASLDNNFYILNIDGKVLHRFKTSGNAEAVALLQKKNLLLGSSFVYPTTTLYLYSLGEKPKLIWKKNINSEVMALAFQGDNIIIGEVSGKVIALSLSGKKLWEFNISESAWGVADIEAGSKAIAVAGDDSNLYLLSDKGKLLWKRFQGRKGYLYGCALEENLSMVGAASQNSMATIYSEDGKFLWRFRTNFSNSDIAISKDGLVGVASWDGHVYILSRKGKLLLTIPVKEPTAVDFNGNYLGITSRNGNAYLYLIKSSE